MRNEKNDVTVSGRIIGDVEFSHEFKGENFYTVKLRTCRISGNVDVIPLLISDRLICVDKLEAGMYVFANGSIRTFNNKTDEGSKLKIYLFVESMDTLNVDVECSDTDFGNLIGYLCKVAPSRETPLGRTITDFVLAVNRPYGKSDYIPCIAWGRNAKYIESLPIGSEINLSGRLQSREYQKNDEIKMAFEFSVSNIKIERME